MQLKFYRFGQPLKSLIEILFDQINLFLNKDSAFISLQRDIASYVHTIQSDSISIKKVRLDFEHRKVLIEQCNKQIDILKKKSLTVEFLFDLTYQLERLIQIDKRLEDILELIQKKKKF